MLILENFSSTFKELQFLKKIYAGWSKYPTVIICAKFSFKLKNKLCVPLSQVHWGLIGEILLWKQFQKISFLRINITAPEYSPIIMNIGNIDFWLNAKGIFYMFFFMCRFLILSLKSENHTVTSSVLLLNVFSQLIKEHFTTFIQLFSAPIL